MGVGKRSDELLKQYIEAVVDEVEQGETDIDTMRFTQMELLGHALGKDIAGQIEQALVARQGERMPGAFACPHCDRACEAEARPKTVHALDGEVQLTEVRCYCPTCRRSFFPAA